MKKQDTSSVEVPITSMIDIVFLLIIFFVVTAAIDKEAVDESIRLAKSYYVPPPTKQDPRTITLNVKRVGDNKPAKIAIAQSNQSLAGLGPILRNMMSKYGNDIPIVVRADGAVKYKEIDRIIEVVGKAGLYRIRLSAQDVGKR